MSNQQQGSNEAPKTPAPTETKPDAQQNQGDGKQGSEKRHSTEIIRHSDGARQCRAFPSERTAHDVL